MRYNPRQRKVIISQIALLITSSPFFERSFILGAPRGFRQKKLQNLDSMNAQHRMKINAGPSGLAVISLQKVDSFLLLSLNVMGS
jgi:hypothetical protein